MSVSRARRPASGVARRVGEPLAGPAPRQQLAGLVLALLGGLGVELGALASGLDAGRLGVRVRDVDADAGVTGQPDVGAVVGGPVGAPERLDAAGTGATAAVTSRAPSRV